MLLEAAWYTHWSVYAGSVQTEICKRSKLLALYARAKSFRNHLMYTIMMIDTTNHAHLDCHDGIFSKHRCSVTAKPEGCIDASLGVGGLLSDSRAKRLYRSMLGESKMQTPLLSDIKARRLYRCITLAAQ